MVGVQEQMALLRLVPLLRAGRDGREWNPLLLAEPAQELQLLQGGQRGRQTAGLGPWGSPVSSVLG